MGLTSANSDPLVVFAWIIEFRRTPSLHLEAVGNAFCMDRGGWKGSMCCIGLQLKDLNAEL